MTSANTVTDHISAFLKLREQLLDSINDEGLVSGELATVFTETTRANKWFDEKNLKQAIEGIIHLLEPDPLQKISSELQPSDRPRNIAVIMPGNIPAAGFHDMLCILLSGNRIKAKLSSDDATLLPHLAGSLAKIDPAYNELISFEDKLEGFDAVIATGSNNSFRYFDHYFSKYPHIFRKNRNSAGIITGNENEFDYILLGRDIFSYFGLGCRNISKLFVPEGYEFDDLFSNITGYSYVMENNKYMNNYDYQRALLLMNETPFLTNNFLMVKEDRSLSSPASVLHYEYYKNSAHLEELIREQRSGIQCVVTKDDVPGTVNPGQTQLPSVTDYADDVDVMEFLAAL